MNWSNREDARREENAIELPNASRFATAVLVSSAVGVQNVYHPHHKPGYDEGLFYHRDPVIMQNQVIANATITIPKVASLDSILEQFARDNYGNPVANNYAQAHEVIHKLANHAINDTAIYPSDIERLVENADAIHTHLANSEEKKIIPPLLADYDPHTLLAEVSSTLAVIADFARQEMEKSRGKNR